MERNIFVFILIYLFTILYGCAGTVFNPEPPEVEIINVKVAQIRFPVTDFVFSITVKNPNDFDIHIEYINMELHVMNQLLTREHWANLNVLYAHQLQDIQIPVTVNLLNVFPIVSQIMSETKIPYVISGRVKLKYDKREHPFKYKGEYVAGKANHMMYKAGNITSEKTIY